MAIRLTDSAQQLRFDTFFATHAVGLRRLGALLTGNAEEGEDIAQEVLTEVHARWNGLDHPLSYARRCVVNRSADNHRRASRWRVREHLLAAPAFVEPEHRELADALLGLSAAQRTALTLRYYLGCTDAEVAEAMDIPLGTAKSHLQRGLAALRAALTEQEHS